MPKLQGFPWHVVSFYNPDKAKEVRKANRIKKKSENNFGIKNEGLENVRTTSYVFANGKMQKVVNEPKISKPRKLVFYKYEGSRIIRYSCTRGKYVYLKNKNGSTMIIKKATFSNWFDSGRIVEVDRKEVLKK